MHTFSLLVLGSENFCDLLTCLVTKLRFSGLLQESHKIVKLNKKVKVVVKDKKNKNKKISESNCTNIKEFGCGGVGVGIGNNGVSNVFFLFVKGAAVVHFMNAKSLILVSIS